MTSFQVVKLSTASQYHIDKLVRKEPLAAFRRWTDNLSEIKTAIEELNAHQAAIVQPLEQSKYTKIEETPAITRTFIYFEKLPLELRARIWRLHIQDHGHIIEVFSIPSKFRPRRHTRPHLLQIGKKLHEEALAFHGYNLLAGKQLQSLYFNGEIDMLFFSEDCSVTWIETLMTSPLKLKNDIKSIALSQRWLIWYQARGYPVLETLKALPNLELVMFVVESCEVGGFNRNGEMSLVPHLFTKSYMASINGTEVMWSDAKQKWQSLLMREVDGVRVAPEFRIISRVYNSVKLTL